MIRTAISPGCRSFLADDCIHLTRQARLLSTHAPAIEGQYIAETWFQMRSLIEGLRSLPS
ncbi:hypothetical protein BST24_16750 [Mycobacteroides franklinii]|nr:hypothetical protein BST24_16750 [Mycobacteroides franklinii]